MIYDKLDNLETYAPISERLAKGLPVNITTAPGVHIDTPDTLYTLMALLQKGDQPCVGEMPTESTAVQEELRFEPEGELKPEVLDVLDIIAKYDIILATGHISHEEAYKLVPEAAKRGVKNIVITHVDFPTTFYSVEDQKMFASYGAKMEHCYTTWATSKCEWSTTVDMIRELGAENVILGTDLGQKTSIYPDEGMASWAEKLLAEGFTEDEIRTMMVTNPRKLLGKE